MSDRIEKPGAEHWYRKAIALQERAEKAEARVEELEALLDCRAGRLLKSGREFIVIAKEEPYYLATYATIRAHEQRAGTWTNECEGAFQEDFEEYGGGEIPPTEQALKARAEKAEARASELEVQQASAQEYIKKLHDDKDWFRHDLRKQARRVAELEQQLEGELGLTAGDAPSLIEQMAGLQLVFNQVVPRGCILMNPQDKQGADGEE